jgi:hypothetical protein
MIIVNGGGGGMDPMVALPCVDGANPMFFGKPVFVDDGHCQWGASGMELTAPIIVINHCNGGHCRLRRRSRAAAAMAVFVNDGRR